MILQAVAGGSGLAARFRRNVPLLGAKDGHNQVFTTPEKFLRSPFQEVVYYNGAAQIEGVDNDYRVSESAPGTGYDTVTFSVALKSWENLTIDYLRA